MTRKKKKKSSLILLVFVGICLGVIFMTLGNRDNKVVAGEKISSKDTNNEEVAKDIDRKDSSDNHKENVVNDKNDDKKSDEIDNANKEENQSKNDETKEEIKEDSNTETSTDEKKEVTEEPLKNETKNDENKIQETIKTSNSKSKVDEAYPNVKKVTYDPSNNIILIDPGHGNRSNLEKEPNAPGSSVMKIKDGGGATGSFTKVPEYIIAMDVSMMLKEKLEELGYIVVMTKTTHEESPGNVERAEIGNNVGAALAIRMHADSAGTPNAYGASMLIPDLTEHTAAIYDESKRCGKILIDAMVEEAGMYNRGLKPRKDITGFNWSKVPVVLVEMGFLSNENEDRLLNTKEYQEKIVIGLAKGIVEALPIQTVQEVDAQEGKSSDSTVNSEQVEQSDEIEGIEENN
ncbi:N-acetylmuramoyl-L-alanine amidase family protein [Oceanirhabdus sp. W0125-5]|uniref:N-acetylmuramoyl-L-alanine amidase family protein n=1 Tax=Oceanirhabdus sp. W0125-5 TaxID=2999116 RepID=UPI0022F2EE49|nr:N-acetylmuramoyl-L-alanine amidase [Oceanirhabdus sp. W0125-5]WBW97485.1 N-acetylmuramoyl-L-alanine amidase [Oceanirhabdus sp. W0125-5]